MGKDIKDFEKNRRNKIARKKKNRKHKVYNEYGNAKGKGEISHKNNDKVRNVFENARFYTKTKDKKEYVFKIPEVLCMIENPDKSISFLKELNFVFDKSKKLRSVYFDYSDCHTLGLGASVIMDKIVINGIDFRKKISKVPILSGNLPKSNSAKELFLISGLYKHLELGAIPNNTVARIEPFQKDKDVSSMTNKTIEYYIECLGRSGFELGENGIKYLSNLVGEVIGNASEHSGEFGDWFVSGHYSMVNDSLGIGKLTFLSFGNTIYETITSENVDDLIKNKLTNHLNNHSKNFNSNWTREMCGTIFALQYKISSKKNNTYPDRGTGTIKFISNFNDLGTSIDRGEPKMIIQSGNTHILFDGAYKLKKQETSDGIEVDVIAFNEENDLNLIADNRKVFRTNNFFPGTIISLGFYVDRKYIERSMEG